MSEQLSIFNKNFMSMLNDIGKYHPNKGEFESHKRKAIAGKMMNETALIDVAGPYLANFEDDIKKKNLDTNIEQKVDNVPADDLKKIVNVFNDIKVQVKKQDDKTIARYFECLTNMCDSYSAYIIYRSSC